MQHNGGLRTMLAGTRDAYSDGGWQSALMPRRLGLLGKGLGVGLDVYKHA